MWISWINFGIFGSNRVNLYNDYEFDPVKALQEIGVNQNEAIKQASLKYLDKFGPPASDDFTMWLFIGSNSEKFSQSIIVQFECLHCIENSTIVKFTDQNRD